MNNQVADLIRQLILPNRFFKKMLKSERWFIVSGEINTDIGYLRVYPVRENLILSMLSYPGRQVTLSCEIVP